MIYLIYGENEYFITKEINSISTNYNSKYNLDENSIKQVIDDAITIPMFTEKKYILIENSLFLASKTNIDTTLLEQYLNHPNPDTILVFTLKVSKLDERKKIIKLFRKKASIIKCEDNINLNQFVIEQFKPYQIDYQSVNLFLNRTGNDILTITNEINKIKIYKDKELTIYSTDILELVSKNIEIDIFKFIDYIIQNNNNSALEMLNEMLKRGEEPIKIVIILANQIRIMYQSKVLNKKGYSEKDISEMLKIHPYRVKLAIQNSINYSEETLLNYLNALADLDYYIKSGKINKNIALSLFIIKKNIEHGR